MSLSESQIRRDSIVRIQLTYFFISTIKRPEYIIELNVG